MEELKLFSDENVSLKIERDDSVSWDVSKIPANKTQMKSQAKTLKGNCSSRKVNVVKKAQGRRAISVRFKK